ncbi:MAG: hypothetical protein RLZZ136_1632 [Pseudomonadota bacterium]
MLTLIPHPDHQPLQVTSVTAAVLGCADNWLRLRWHVQGSAAVIVPPFAGKGRADGLWQTTCFELFVKEPGNPAYSELNLSPSEQWASYDFADYRAGMANRTMPRAPDCTLRRGGGMMIFDAAIPLAGLPALPWLFGLSAVIEEAGGVKSYWALGHSDGKADFHHPSCFAARLTAPGAL